LHDIIGARPLAAKLLKHSRSRCAAAVAISQAVADDARIVLPCVPIAVVTNRIELTDFTPGESHGEQLDLQAGMSVPSENPTRIGLVATYARWKGQFVFLEAASRVLQDNLDFPIRWYVVGGPIYHTAAQFSRDELLTEIARLGLTGRVGLVPFAQQPAWIYRSLDIVVHASTQPEPFGLTIAEAMACGRPVIVSAAGGAKELFTDRVDAWGVSPGDVEELAHAMLKLAQTPELRDQLSQQARNTAESKFDSKEYAPELIKVYEQVLRHSISSK
jgi:glycosyltransferase involved in cell wall biosynthesis